MFVSCYHLCFLACVLSSRFSSTDAYQPPVGLEIYQALSLSNSARTADERYVAFEKVKNEAFRLLRSLASRIHFGFRKNSRVVNPFELERITALDTSGKRSSTFTTRMGELFNLLRNYFESTADNIFGGLTPNAAQAEPNIYYANPWLQMTRPQHNNNIKVQSHVVDQEYCNTEIALALQAVCPCSLENNQDVSVGDGDDNVNTNIQCHATTLDHDGTGAGVRQEDFLLPLCSSVSSIERLLDRMPRFSSPVQRFAVRELQRFTNWLSDLPAKCTDRK